MNGPVALMVYDPDGDDRRGTSIEVGRYDGNVVTLERLCGQCGTPLASHTEGDRKFCDTLAPKGGAS